MAVIRSIYLTGIQIERWRGTSECDFNFRWGVIEGVKLLAGNYMETVEIYLSVTGKQQILVWRFVPFSALHGNEEWK